MRFPMQDQLDLPCVLERIVPGKLHPDGRRYLPLIVLRPAAGDGPPLGVVDRHHRVREADVGRQGRALLVCALSQLRLQAGARRGVAPEPGYAAGGVSAAPLIYGQVRAVAAWERGAAELPYESLYTELVLDIGIGVVGLRTSVTAADLAAAIGKAALEPGDFVELTRSRIDILGFEAR
jgi:hypothetical protein